MNIKRKTKYIPRLKGQPSTDKSTLYRSIANNCINCVGNDKNRMWEVGNCSDSECVLKPHRPYQHLKGVKE